MRELGLPLRRIVLSLLFAAATLAGASGLAWAEPACQVIALRGTATLERAGARSALATGTELGMGDLIATDAGARVKLRFADGSQVKLGENTQLRIDLAKFSQAEGKRNILLNLPMGLLRAAAAKLPSTTGSSFEIHTGIGYSAVRGTDWIMVATSDETRVHVREGGVSVGTDFPSNQFPKLVEGGRWVLVSREDGVGEIAVTPPGSLDSLIEQTEAAVFPGTPGTDLSDTAEITPGMATDDASAPTGAVGDMGDNDVDPTTSAGSTTPSASSSTGTGSSTTDASNSGATSSSASNTDPNNSPNGSSGGGSGGGSSSSSGGGSSSGGSSSAGGSGKLGGSNKGSNKSSNKGPSGKLK